MELTQDSDEARRASDAVNLALVANAEASGRWIAIRLSDGGSDGVLYDRKADAVRHQLHETQCAYVKIPPTGMTPRQAAVFLTFNRQLYAAGYRLQDPDRDVQIPQTFRSAAALRRGRPI